jgi:hypothetical protein
MAEQDHSEAQALSDEELDGQEGEELPDREVMTILPIDPTAGSKFLPDAPPLDGQ